MNDQDLIKSHAATLQTIEQLANRAVQLWCTSQTGSAAELMKAVETIAKNAREAVQTAQREPALLAIPERCQPNEN